MDNSYKTMTNKETNLEAEPIDIASFLTDRNEADELSIGQHIQTVRGKDPRSSLAARMKVSEQTIGRYERGERLPDSSFIRAFCIDYQISPLWLLFGIGDKNLSSYENSTLTPSNFYNIEFIEKRAKEKGIDLNKLRQYEREFNKPLGELYKESVDSFLNAAFGLSDDAVDLSPKREISSIEGSKNNYIYLPIFTSKPSLGYKEWNEYDSAKDFIAFSRQWLQSEITQNLDDLCLLIMPEESMETTLHAGDLVMIDQSIKDVGEDGIYALVLKYQLSIKRLQRLPGRSIRVSCDNPVYKEFIMDDDFDDADHYISGKVVWVGKKL